MCDVAVRDLTDGKGQTWRVWDVTPEELNPRTQDETFLAQLYYTGWLVFEKSTGEEKRRLYPIPRGWEALPDLELEVLLQKSEVVPPRKLKAEREATGAAAAAEVKRAVEQLEQMVDEPEASREVAREETPDVTDLRVVRSFRYPGGRIWVASVAPNREPGQPPLLRFSAGARQIDLAEWPKDWVDYPVEELVKLLRLAAPRSYATEPPPDSPRRRWDDARLGGDTEHRADGLSP